MGEDTVNEQRPRDVLEALLAEVVKLGIDFAAHLAEGVLRDADAAGFGDPFESCRDVDAIAVDVAVFDNDVAEVHSDPEGDPLFFRCPGIAFGHPRCTATAQATASITLGNSIRMPSPVVLTMRP